MRARAQAAALAGEPRHGRVAGRRSALPWILAACACCALPGALSGLQWFKVRHAQEKLEAVFPVGSRPAAPAPPLAPKAARRIVLFGDSRIAQWRDFPLPAGAQLVMRGVPGETTAQMRLRFQRDVLAADPDVVVMQLGINDLTAIGVLPALRDEIVRQCDANVRYFVRALLGRGVRVILLTIIPPGRPPLWRLPFWSGEIGEQAAALNRLWLAAPAGPLLSVVDTQAILQGADGRWREDVLADTLHLAAPGYERLNTAIRGLLGS